MALAEPIKLRLTVEQRRQYEDEATARNMELGPYIRHRLDQADRVADQLAALRNVVEDRFLEQENPAGAGDTHRAGLGPADAGMMVEMLLLLRSVVAGDKLQIVHGELRRQGLPVWTGQHQ
jgi:hypothetical protein